MVRYSEYLVFLCVSETSLLDDYITYFVTMEYPISSTTVSSIYLFAWISPKRRTQHP